MGRRAQNAARAAEEAKRAASGAGDAAKAKKAAKAEEAAKKLAAAEAELQAARDAINANPVILNPDISHRGSATAGPYSPLLMQFAPNPTLPRHVAVAVISSASHARGCDDAVDGWREGWTCLVRDLVGSTPLLLRQHLMVPEQREHEQPAVHLAFAACRRAVLD